MSRRSLATKNRYQVSEQLRAGLDFPDLVIKLSSGQTRALHVEAGQFVPTELLDERDVALSEHSGCIFRSLRAGWLINPDAPVQPKEEKVEAKKESSQPKHEYKLVETISPEDFAKMRDKSGTVTVINASGPQPAVQVEVMRFSGSMPIQNDDRAVGTTKEGTSVVMSPETRKDPDATGEISKIQEVVKVGGGLPNNYTEFAKLTHFAKLDVIKLTNNITLLKEVVAQSEVKQLVNNANGRLRELETPA